MARQLWFSLGQSVVVGAGPYLGGAGVAGPGGLRGVDPASWARWLACVGPVLTGWRRSGCAAPSSPATSRTSGASASAPPADHAGFARTAKQQVNRREHRFGHPQVEQFAADGVDEAFGDRVRPRCPHGCPMTLMSMAVKTASKLAVNLLSRSRIRKWKRGWASSRFMSRLRACWVGHAPVGVGGDTQDS